MNRASSPSRGLAGDLVAMAVVLGIASGLLEGVGHMALQKMNLLENVWYPIIWIAAAFNGVVVGLLGVMVSLVVARFPNYPRLRTLAVFIIVLAAYLPCLALMLKEYLQWYSILAILFGGTAATTRMVRRHEAATFRGFRRGLVWAIAGAVAAAVGIDGGAWLRERRATSLLPAADVSAPNVLVIVIDALRADHLSSYGYVRPSSPGIDRLAAQGVLFEHAFSTSSYTLPSHASIVTGLYPHEHGVEWGTSHAMELHPTLPEILQTRGYRTGAFSGNTYWFTREHGFGKGFQHFEDFFHSLADKVFRTAYGRILSKELLGRLGYEDIPGRKHATDINRAVLRWTGRDAAHPFFVMINYMDVHDPYLPPQPFRSRFSQGPDPGGLINWEWHVPEKLTPDELQGEIDAYDGAIAYVDDQIDRLVTALQQTDRTRHLLVIVTSDHGEEFGEHGGFLHGGHLYREVIQVPLVVWQPGRVPAGTRVSRPVSNASIAATILDVIGAAPASNFVPSLKRLWTDDQSDQDWAFPLAELMRRPWEDHRTPVHHGSMRSLVAPSLHYIDHTQFGPQLYDWIHDSREAHDLATRPDMLPAVEQFRNQLPAGGRAAHGR
jgi:arylsulfatase A-like enzyme